MLFVSLIVLGLAPVNFSAWIVTVSFILLNGVEFFQAGER